MASEGILQVKSLLLLPVSGRLAGLNWRFQVKETFRLSCARDEMARRLQMLFDFSRE